MLETDSICAKSCAEMEIGMDKENAIEVKNITKDFKVYYDKGSELKERCFSGNVTDMRKDMY